MRGRISVQLIEIRHAHGEVGIGKELDGFCLSGIGEQDRNIFLDGAALQQLREALGSC